MDPFQKLENVTEGTLELKNLDTAQPLPRAESQFATGTVIAGQYKILDFIGAGGMSRVYKCEDLTINRIVAVKTLQLGATEDAVRRVQVEGKAIARLEHPNIVKLYGLQLLPDGAPMLTMEFIAGTTLSQILESGIPLGVQRAMRIAAQICAGLCAAHHVGVVHRDLKPSNIMILQPGSQDERVKLLDFGIAKVQEEVPAANATRTGEIFGTPTYMSPEQALGKRCGPQTDQYSLGCVLYEMLTGKPPFSGNSQLEIMMAHVQEAVVPIDKVSSKQIPRHVIGAINKMLEKNPADRFATMDDGTQALFSPGKKEKFWSTRKVVIATATFLAFSGIGLIIFWQFADGLKLGGAAHSAVSNSAVGSATSPVIDSAHNLSTDDIKFAEWVKSHPDVEVISSKAREFAFMPHVTDAGLQCLEPLTKLHALNLSQWPVTGGALQYLVNLPLDDLDIGNMDLKASNIRSLTRLKDLKKLSLTLSTVDDEGCKLLPGMKKLEDLHIDTTGISHEALADICRIPNLRALYLNNDQVSRGFGNFFAPNLTELSVSGVKLTHKDILDIARIKSIKSLFLGNTEIDDSDLLVLAKLPDLDQIFVPNCARLTGDGLQKFTNANSSNARVITDKNATYSAEPRRKKSGPNLLSNSSFEIRPVPGRWVDIGPGNKLVPGWTVSRGSISVAGHYWKAPDGEVSIELNGDSSGAIEQTFKTVPGTTYLVNFMVSRNPNSYAEYLNFEISAGGQSKEFRIAAPSQSRTMMLWQPYSWQFVANSARSTLAFNSLSDGKFGVAIDNVTVYTAK